MKIEIGKFEIASGEAIISDPCYTPDSFCEYRLECQKGQYTAFVLKKDAGNWGERIFELEAILSSKASSSNWKEVPNIGIGVDSGQAGIFDATKYCKDEFITESDFGSEPWDCDGPFYSACGSHTLSDKHAGVLSFGAVSSSGYGDGAYELQILEDGEGIYGMKIIFINEN